MRAELYIPKPEAEFYSKILQMTGKEIYETYGLKRDEVFCHTAHFVNGYEAELKIIICDWNEYPYVEMILLNEDREEVCSVDAEDEIMKSWWLYSDETEYEVKIKTKEV